MKSILALTLLLFCCSCIYSQDFDKLTDSYLGENAEGFTQPAVDMFCGFTNTGLKNEIAIDKKLYFKIGIVGSAVFISESQKTFTGKTDETFTPYQEVVVPTIVGANEPISVQGKGGTTYTFPGGLNLSYLPVATPQITVGGLYGSELLLRFITIDIKDKIGKVQFLGAGLRHNIGQYFTKGTVDVSLGYYLQNFKVGEYMNTTTHYIELGVGKKFGFLNLYGMAGYQIGNMVVKYDTNNENNVDVKLNPSNSLRGGVGLGFDFNLFHLFFEGHYATQMIATAGFGFKF